MRAQGVVGTTLAIVLALLLSVAGRRAAAEVIQAERVTDTTTSIPGGTGTFTGFGAPGLNADAAAFFGTGSGGQEGVYERHRPTAADPFPDPKSAADLSTPIPGGTGTFTDFSSVGIGATEIAFLGSGSGGQEGVYVAERQIATAEGPRYQLADKITSIPGGTGTFTDFASLVFSATDLAFIGSGSGGQKGIYISKAREGNRIPDAQLADTSTTIPGGTGTFTDFSSVDISATDVAFVGSGSGGQQGVYRVVHDFLPGGFTTKLADKSTAIPGGTGTFTGFSSAAIGATDIAFLGSGSGGQQGVYTASLPQASDPPGFIPFQRRIADANTLIPGGVGPFTGFESVDISATDVLFLGSGAGGQSGIFDYRDGTLLRLVNVGDILDGKVITGLSFTGGGLFDDSMAFGASFVDGSQGIYIMNVPEPTSFLLLAVGGPLLGISLMRRRIWSKVHGAAAGLSFGQVAALLLLLGMTFSALQPPPKS